MTGGENEPRVGAGPRGATALLTGLPAAGKSTIARALECRLRSEGRAAYVLDGDVVRRGLSSDLGFSPAERTEHLRRVGEVAALLADAGLIALAAVIAPMAADRALMRRAHETAGLPYFEVFVDAPVEECARRDPKGLYARARAGEIRGFTGVDAPYEAPVAPEVRVATAELTVDAAVERILAELGTGGG